MVLADRGFANHNFLSWLQASSWHYCIRIPCDTRLHGIRRYPVEVTSIYPKKGEAAFYRHVGLWQDGYYRCNLVVAYPKGVKEHWAVITDESPTLQTLWQYALRFRVEELFLDSKSGMFEERRFSSSVGWIAWAFVFGCCPSFTLLHKDWVWLCKLLVYVST